MVAVPVPSHECHEPAGLARMALSLGFPVAAAAPTLEGAIGDANGAPVAILGSLYLAGEALKVNCEVPD